jgi:hypothetical protein
VCTVRIRETNDKETSLRAWSAINRRRDGITRATRVRRCCSALQKAVEVIMDAQMKGKMKKGNAAIGASIRWAWSPSIEIFPSQG